jgi:hypothetical protein
MHLFRNVKLFKNIFIFSVVLIFSSLTLNIFGVTSTDKLFNDHNSTEALYGNQIVCEGVENGGFLLSNWENGIGNTQTDTCDGTAIPYWASYNILGRTYEKIYGYLGGVDKIGVNTYLKATQLFNALLLAIVLSLFSVWVRAKFGIVPAVTTVFLISISVELINKGSTLIAHYNFMSFVPLIYTLYFYKYSSIKKYKILFYLGLTIVFCLKALTNYEYITTIAFMIFAVIAFNLYKDRMNYTAYIKEFLIASAAIVVGLFSAFAVHASAIARYNNESFSQGIEIIYSSAIRRSAGNEYSIVGVNPYWGLNKTLPEIYELLDEYIDMDKANEDYNNLSSRQGNLQGNAISILNYVLLPVVKLPLMLPYPFAIFFQSFGALLLLLAVLWKARKKVIKDENALRSLEALYVAVIISFIGYLSWQILARNHTLVHPHLNGFTMYIPFALFSYVIIGVYLSKFIKMHLFNIEKLPANIRSNNKLKKHKNKGDKK